MPPSTTEHARAQRIQNMSLDCNSVNMVAEQSDDHRDVNENSPSISAEMLTIAVCTRADRAERASMVSVPTVVLEIQETDIDRENDVKNPDDSDARLTVRAMETRCV